MTTADLKSTVREAVGALLTNDEIAHLSVDGRAPGAAPDGSVIAWLHLVVSAGEQFDLPLVQPGVVEIREEMVERVISELQDWIAESRFAWGQLRLPH